VLADIFLKSDAYSSWQLILNRRQEEIIRKWPPGLVLMPEAEQQAALSSLQKGILAFNLFLA
jgi:hypothetical protein